MHARQHEVTLLAYKSNETLVPIMAAACTNVRVDLVCVLLSCSLPSEIGWDVHMQFLQLEQQWALKVTGVLDKKRILYSSSFILEASGEKSWRL